MKTKLKRFAIHSAILVPMLFLAYMLFDYFDGTAREKVKEELILSVIVGIMTSAALVFFSKFYSDPKE